MSWFSDNVIAPIHDTVAKIADYIPLATERATANPTKLVADIATLGVTAALRELPKGIGGGQSGYIAKGTVAYGAAVIGAGSGAATGFITGGPIGAIYGAGAGGVAGAGAGISGIVHDSSGGQIAVRAAQFGAISGAAVGLGATFAGSGWSASGGKAATSFIGPKAPVGSFVGANGTTVPVAAGSSGFIGPVASVAPVASGSSGFWGTAASTLVLGALNRGGAPGGASGGSPSVENVILPPESGPSVNPISYPGASGGSNGSPLQPGSGIISDLFSPSAPGALAALTSPVGLFACFIFGFLLYTVFKGKGHA